MRRATRGGFDAGVLIHVNCKLNVSPFHPLFLCILHSHTVITTLHAPPDVPIMCTCAHDEHMCTLPLGLFDCSNRVRSLALLPLVYSTYCRCPSDTSLQLRLMIGLGCTAFLLAGTLLALDLKFGWSRKKGGGRLKPIINAIQSLTVLIMYPSKVRTI